MGGTPIRNAQEAHLTANEMAVFQDRANGMVWRKLAAKWGTSAHVLNLWLKAVPDRLAAWHALDKVIAELKAGDAETILDDAHSLALTGMGNPESTRLAIARSELAKWQAGVMDRAKFGAPNAQGAFVLNVGTLHLTAVRELNAAPPPPPADLLPSAPIADAEFEVIEDPATTLSEPSLDDLLGTAEPTLDDLLGTA